MPPISKTNVNTADLAPYESGWEVLEGDLRPQMYFLTKVGDHSLNLTSGVFACQPGTVRSPLTQYETIHVIEGEVRIELDSGETVEAGPGDIVSLPRGPVATWTFKTPFKEFFLLASSKIAPSPDAAP